MSGDQAYAWSLVNRLAPPDELIATATALLRMITRHDPAVVAAQKRLHWDWLGSTYEQAVADSIEPFVSAFITGTPQRIAAERLSKR